MSEIRNFFKDIGKSGKARPSGLEDGPELIVVVMGSTGTGKSSLINSLTGRKSVKVSDKLASDTSEIKVTDWTFARRRVKLVDTPGFDDTYLSDTEVLLMIADFLQGRFGRKVFVNGIIYLHRIIDPRMTGTAMKNLQLLQDICGNESLSNVLLVTTFWEHVPPDIGSRRERELANDFWRPLVELGSKIYRYRFKSSGKELMQEILDHQSSIIELQIQAELTGAGPGGSLLDTTVGRRVQAGLHHQLEQLGMTLKHVQEEEKALQARREMEKGSELGRVMAHASRINEEMAKLEKDLILLERPRENKERDWKISEIARQKGIEEMDAFWVFYGADDDSGMEGGPRDSITIPRDRSSSPTYRQSGYGEQMFRRESNADYVPPQRKMSDSFRPNVDRR